MAHLNWKSNWIDWNQTEKNDIKSQFIPSKDGVIGTTLVLCYMFCTVLVRCVYFGDEPM